MVPNNKALGKTVMVTGGAGYVGSILVRKLLQEGYRVVCVDYLRYGGGSLLDIWGHPNFVLEKIDITDTTSAVNLFEQYDFHGVIHLAAIVGDPACKLLNCRSPQDNKQSHQTGKEYGQYQQGYSNYFFNNFARNSRVYECLYPWH